MIDREKVIKGLQCCKSPNDHEHCPYNTGVHYNVCTYWLLSDAVELLKEQEPEPVGLYGKDDWYGLVCVCPDCKAEWMSGKSDTHFCPNCGKAVKWDEAD